MIRPRWYYDEFKQFTVDYTDIEEVQSYDLNMQRLRDIKKEFKLIRDILKISENDVVLEIGTGTGELALDFSMYCKRVVAVDVSERMIEFARTKAAKRKIENLEFCHGGFLTYECNEESFDAVISQLALHHLNDFWKMIALRRIYKMLKKGGRFYLRDVVFPTYVQDYDDYFGNIINETRKTAGEKIGSDIETHIKDEFSTLDWIMEGLLKSVGFKIEEMGYFDGFIATYACKK